MILANAPAPVPLPWASSAPGTLITSIAVTSSVGGTTPSWQQGWTSPFALPGGSGGVPPSIQVENTLENFLSAGLQYEQMGGGTFFNSTLATNMGGYPQGAVVQSASTLGLFWLNQVDNNSNNPDVYSTGWQPIGSMSRTTDGSGNYKYTWPLQGGGLLIRMGGNVALPVSGTGTYTFPFGGFGTKADNIIGCYGVPLTNGYQGPCGFEIISRLQFSGVATSVAGSFAVGSNWEATGY
jgi:hypothetical protein